MKKIESSWVFKNYDKKERFLAKNSQKHRFPAKNRTEVGISPGWSKFRSVKNWRVSSLFLSLTVCFWRAGAPADVWQRKNYRLRQKVVKNFGKFRKTQLKRQNTMTQVEFAMTKTQLIRARSRVIMTIKLI